MKNKSKYDPKIIITNNIVVLFLKIVNLNVKYYINVSTFKCKHYTINNSLLS